MGKGEAAARNYAREFDNALQSIGGGRYQTWRLFSDFCEMAACALAQGIVRTEAREAQYLDVVKRYDAPEHVQAVAGLMAIVVDALEEEPQDFLGAAFMRLELGNHWKGQFFTPFELCRMLAEMTMGDAPAMIEANGFITVAEPACGAGAMVIACAMALKAQGLDYSRVMYVEATDVDATAAHMAFIQLSLLGISAEVVIGNTLTMERRDVLRTPTFHLCAWPSKLFRRSREKLLDSNTTSHRESAHEVSPIAACEGSESGRDRGGVAAGGGVGGGDVGTGGRVPRSRRGVQRKELHDGGQKALFGEDE